MATTLYFRTNYTNHYDPTAPAQFYQMVTDRGAAQASMQIGASSNSAGSLWTITNTGAKVAWLSEPIATPVQFSLGSLTVALNTAQESAAAANVAAYINMGKIDPSGVVETWIFDETLTVNSNPTTEFPTLSAAQRSISAVIPGYTVNTNDRIWVKVFVTGKGTGLALTGTRTADFLVNGANAGYNDSNITFNDETLTFQRRMFRTS